MLIFNFTLIKVAQRRIINKKGSKMNREIISPQYQAHIAVYEIASLIGKHEYRSQNEAIYGIIQKDATFSNVIAEIKLETNNTIESDTNNIMKAEAALLSSKAAELLKIKGFSDLNDIADFKVDQIMNIISKKYDDLSSDENLFRRVRIAIRRKIAMIRGRKLEKPAIDRLEIEKRKSVTDRNAKRYEHKCGHYVIQGLVDGIMRSDNCIIEIKNRMFKQEVPIYDMIQCVVYMKLTGLRKCLLVEIFPDESMRETLYEWNEKQFDLIHSRLCQVVDLVRKYTRQDVAYVIEQSDRDQLKSQ